MRTEQPMAAPLSLRPFARTVNLPRAGTSLYYYEAGAAASPVLLLVHGLGDEADTWRSVIAPLSLRFRIIAPDLPGFGRSSLPRRRLTPPYLAGVLLELLDELHIANADGIGSSLGAVLLQCAAARDPSRFSRLVLEDGGLGMEGRIPPGFLLSLLPVLGERRYRLLAGNLQAAYDSLRPYYAELDGMPMEDREFLRRRVADRVTSRTQRRAYFSAFRGYVGWLALRGRRMVRRARGCAHQVLVIWGSEDHIVPLSSANGAKGADGAMEVIAGAGHLPHQEKPEAFLRVVESFLGAGGSGGRRD